MLVTTISMTVIKDSDKAFLVSASDLEQIMYI